MIRFIKFITIWIFKLIAVVFLAAIYAVRFLFEVAIPYTAIKVRTIKLRKQEKNS